jgi:hypothetical protein
MSYGIEENPKEKSIKNQKNPFSQTDSQYGKIKNG